MIERTTSGVVNLTLDYMDELRESKDVSIKDKIKLHAALVNSARQMGTLELSNRTLELRSPETAKGVRPLKLVHNEK